MNQALSMGNAPSVRASRALHPVNVRKMCARAISLARRKSLTIALISAGVSYAGILLGSEIVNCLAAFVTLSFVCIADSTQKGGDK